MKLESEHIFPYITFQYLLKGFIGLAFICLIFGCKPKDQNTEADDALVITCGVVAQEFDACKKGVALWEKQTGKKVKVIPAPNGSTERLTLFQQHLAAESPDIDIYQIDVVWPGMLEPHFIDLNPHLSDDLKKSYVPQLIENNTVRGRLIALPWFINMGFLYYRKDLLKKYNLPVPITWEELEESALKILQAEHKSGNTTLWGYVFQGKAHEVLTCNALEWIHSYKDGGQIVEKDGQVSINNPDAIGIINRIASWVGTISPQGVLNYEQEDCRGIFQLGQAIFMRNWPYAWGVLNSEESTLAGKIGITLLPKGGMNGRSSAVMGGWNLAISKYSRHQKDAIDLVKFLTGTSELKRRALTSGYYPTMIHLYKDSEILAISPLIKLMPDVLKNAVPRPAAQTGSKYSQVSATFWNMVYATLAKQGSAQKTLAIAEKKMNFLSKNGTRWYKKKE